MTAVGRKSTQTDKRARRYIRITDSGKWEQIDKLTELKKYRNSFNLLINDALDYGLPELCKSLFEPVDIENNTEPKPSVRIEINNDSYFAEVVKLLKEIIVNVTVNKSMLSSLFNAKSSEYNGQAVSGKKFNDGAYRDTPSYIEDYELRALRDLRRLTK